MKDFLKIAGVVTVLAVVGSYLTLAANVVTAPSRVVNRTLQTSNIITNYEKFFDINANYTSRLAQVRSTQKLLDTTSDDAEKTRLRVDLEAQRASCRDLANEYNASSLKMNQNLFKSHDLPYSLSMENCDA